MFPKCLFHFFETWWLCTCSISHRVWNSTHLRTDEQTKFVISSFLGFFLHMGLYILGLRYKHPFTLNSSNFWKNFYLSYLKCQKTNVLGFFILTFHSLFTSKGIWNKLQDCKAVTDRYSETQEIHNDLVITVLNYTLSQFTVMPFKMLTKAAQTYLTLKKNSKDSFENR